MNSTVMLPTDSDYHHHQKRAERSDVSRVQR